MTSTTWDQLIDELEGRGFTVDTLEHALLLAGQRIQQIADEPAYEDGQRILRWVRDHRE